MNYSVEKIYQFVGKDDLTAGLSFKYNSASYKTYGSFTTVLFLYTQQEREKLDENIKNNLFNSEGSIKAKSLDIDLSKELAQKIEREGINSNDIIDIITYYPPRANTFHSSDKREIKKYNIKINSQGSGNDLNWMYGFTKKQVNEGIGLCPEDRAFYLAGKYYYEPDELTKEEVDELFEYGLTLKADIEYQYLMIKDLKEEITPEEMKRFGELILSRNKYKLGLLNEYLNHVGSSLIKLAKVNIDQAVKLYDAAIFFNEHTLNSGGRVPIYIDLDSYLHIFLRHVEEMQVNKVFESKDNFQWNMEDILIVMEMVIESANDEIQEYFSKNPNKRYSRYGDQSVYFQGDYYTFHIEPNGKISTFHKNKKKLKDKEI